MAQHKEFQGEYGQTDSDETLKLQLANQIARSHDEHLEQIGVVTEETYSQESKYASIGLEKRSEENDNSLNDHTILSEDLISIDVARVAFDEFDYQKGCDICLELLRRDYNNNDAHSLILDTFHTLGFKNELIINLKAQLRQIMLQSK